MRRPSRPPCVRCGRAAARDRRAEVEEPRRRIDRDRPAGEEQVQRPVVGGRHAEPQTGGRSQHVGHRLVVPQLGEAEAEERVPTVERVVALAQPLGRPPGPSTRACRCRSGAPAGRAPSGTRPAQSRRHPTRSAAAAIACGRRHDRADGLECGLALGHAMSMMAGIGAVRAHRAMTDGAGSAEDVDTDRGPGAGRDVGTVGTEPRGDRGRACVRGRGVEGRPELAAVHQEGLLGALGDPAARSVPRDPVQLPAGLGG